jgi:Uncharacterized protein conserved in bacteria
MEDKHGKELDIFNGDAVMQETIMAHANELLDTLLDFKELMFYYSSAIREIRTKLEILDTEFELKYQRNPISSIQSRLKSRFSIIEKLQRKGLEITTESMEANLNDIAGIRVICYYVDDIYSIADALIRQNDIELIERKDYIANPKPNGYRSLHLIISVPVYFAESTRRVKAEIQIRTIAMDFWASLEHQIKYKKEISDPEQIADQLKKCADIITYTDLLMQTIRHQTDNEQPEKSELDLIYDKLKKFDVPIGE